jgi:sulfite reductase (NADPH) flavoprotein alpha-component
MPISVQLPEDAPFTREQRLWLNQFLGEALASTASVSVAEEIARVEYSKSNPFSSEVIENFNLNGGSDKQTHHIALSLAGSGLEYQAGDALGVLPQNPSNVADEIIAHLPFEATTLVNTSQGETTLRVALIEAYDIGSLNKMVVQKWQLKSDSPELHSLVVADDKKRWDDFCWGRELIDLVVDHPANFSSAQEFIGLLKKIQPRLYSIASSPHAHPGEVHLCVGIVRYAAHGRERGGICSTFLADRMTSALPPKVFVHQNPAFRPPAAATTPMIMIGPGTGIAPFRAFLEQRKATAAGSENWLFFGNPHRATDFLYEAELRAFLEDGTLSRLDLAWSRDQPEKIYVQNLMLEAGAELWSWLNKGAAFYVCGDASRMAKDVDQALHEIIQHHGHLAAEDATAFIVQLKKDKRYLRDVY